MTKVKICGITNLEDALLSVKFGADALGFNFYAKSPRYILPKNAREIIEQLPAEVLKVGVFVNESLETITEIAEIAKLNALQLHGEETPEFAQELKLKTGLEIIKAFRVSPDFTPEDVLKYEVDAILLDAYNPQEHGGTGETFDWEIAKKVQEIFPKMYLAGGLRHENIYRVIHDVAPFAVDVCSGIEKQKGKKDKLKLINFMAKALNAEKSFSRKTLYDFFIDVHRIPHAYLKNKSFTSFSNFNFGFFLALKFSNAKYDTGLFYTKEFDKFIAEKLNDFRLATNWESKILQKCNGNEEKAFDFFFALLEEFKLEKEDLNS